MKACTQYIESGEVIWYNGKCVSGKSRSQTTIPPEKRQKFWKQWAEVQKEDAEE